jgi:dual specificity tyrosine-phosphorylation-regulated kinase 2/3/4
MRSISLLPSQIDLKVDLNSAKSSCDLESFKKRRRTPPSRNLRPACSQVKKSVSMTPSKVLLNHYDQLSEFEYKEIFNYPEIFYLSKTKRKFTGDFCDEKFYYRGYVGDHIAYRYEILKMLGDGSFGIAIQCLDHKTQSQVAVKVLRKGKKFEKVGEEEVVVLDVLKLADDEDCIVNKFDQFRFRGHFCIVYELLSNDLFDFLKKNNFVGLSSSLIKRIAIQLIISLKHIHSTGYIHCDLKPENIIFKYSNKSSIKIIDFGSACQKNDRPYTYIQSRFYRAPEVILECGYSEKIDIWSLGCILFELYKGSPLFQGNNELDQLCRIVEVVGQFPESMLSSSKRKEKFFKGGSILTDKNGDIIKPATRTLPVLMRNSDKKFIEFLEKCLEIDPNKRISAEAALNDPWIKGKEFIKKNSFREENSIITFI